MSNLIEVARRPISLEAPTDEDEETEIGDFVEDTHSPAPSELTDQEMLRRHLSDALHRLPESGQCNAVARNPIVGKMSA